MTNSIADPMIEQGDAILVSGAAGFIGARVVDSLLRSGFGNIRCFVRPSSETAPLQQVLARYPGNKAGIVCGNMLSRSDCALAVHGVKLVIHLVTGRGKSFPGCFQNSVVTTRNLLDALVQENQVRRLVNVSSFAVYSNLLLRRGATLAEGCPLEDNLEERYDAYVYAKLKQDELVDQYRAKHRIPAVTMRPGIVIGPGKRAIPGTVGIDTFGVFLHLGGSTRLPLTYVDNCADAIVMAGLVRGVEGQVFNIVDDDLPTSRSFLRQYKREVHNFTSIPVPYRLFHFFCFLWEIYARRSEGQLPPVFNRRSCAFAWKGHCYPNDKLKQQLGWRPMVPMGEALRRYFDFQKNGEAPCG